MGRPFIDLSGERFGSLVTLKRVENNKNNDVQWLCQCDCGKTLIVTTQSLRNGRTKSCGCYKQKCVENMKTCDGESDTKLHRVWCNIKTRCTNPNYDKYKYYGGKGVKMCDEWQHSFLAFKKWCYENGWDESLEIDRIDNNGDYSPDNCRCITHKANCRNRSTSRKYEIDGIEMCLSEIAERYCISEKTIRYRLNCGLSPVEAVTKPIISKYNWRQQ